MAGIDANTSLCLHLNNNVTDASDAAHEITNTNVTFSDTVKKFGSHAAFFISNAKLSAVASSDFVFGAGDFTIDFWAYSGDISQGGTGNSVGIIDNANYPTGGFAISIDGGTLNFRAADGASWAITLSVTTIPATWTHYAVVRYGTSWKFYVNGVSSDSDTSSITIGTGANLRMGYYQLYFNGYIDEMRISKGIARWTTDFTPPTAEYSSEEEPVLTAISGTFTQTRNTAYAMTINPSAITSLPTVDADSYFKVVSNWKSVVMFYKHSSGQTKSITFDNNGSDVFADYSCKFNSKARTGTFSISEIYILDYEGGSFKLSGVNIPTGLDITVS